MLQFPPTEFYVGNQQGGQEACETRLVIILIKIQTNNHWVRRASSPNKTATSGTKITD